MTHYAISDKRIKLYPGDDNQLIAMLRAGQGDVQRAVQVIEVFLQYQQYDKMGKHVIQMCINTNTALFLYFT
jgi:ABC-type transport system substrate-binding protein